MDDLIVNSQVTIPGWELWFTASRSSGPGGQHANKASTRITLYWNLASTTALRGVWRQRVINRLRHRLDQDGVLQVSAEDERSQLRNKGLARERLAALVAQALVVPKYRRKTRPSRNSQRRRVDQKKQRGALKANRGRDWREGD